MDINTIISEMPLKPYELDQMYAETASVESTLRKYYDIFSEKLGNKHLPTFETNYDIEKGLRSIKHNLLYLIKNMIFKKMPNIPVPMEQFISAYDEEVPGSHLNTEKAITMLYNNYYLPGRDLALADIIHKARRLVSLSSEQKTREEKIKAILSNHTIKLHVLLDTFFSPKIDYRSRDNLNALDKLVRIILEKQTPESAEPEGITDILEPLDNVLGTHVCKDFRHVELIKIFKNGNIYINFKTPLKAAEVAQALI